MSVAIFGAGIAGCTVAHLLCTKGYKVHLFEASDQIGGFVKTFRNENGIPQEHSPRIVLNDYHLLEKIFKDLEIEDHLLDDSHFEDTIYPLFGKPHHIWENISLTFQEIVLLFYYIILGLVSKKHLDYTDFIPVYNIIRSSKSRKWFDTLSLIAGERPDVMPVYKIIQIVKSKFKNLFRRTKTLKGPWSEYFFNYWEEYLKQNGVEIYYNTPVKQFDPTINNAIVEKDGQLRYLTADVFVLATNISNSIEIFNKTNLQEKNLKQLKQNLKQLFYKTKSQQMGMQIYFPEKIKTKNRGYFTIQSDWQLIVHMQETTWEQPMKGSLWSVVIPEMSLFSKRLNKKAINCTPEEIQEEVLHQLRFIFDLPSPSGFYIWPAWSFDNNQWTTTEPYFWNAVGTKHLRPKQEVLENLYLVGAYTDTNYYQYYMEGAVESGFLACEKILGMKLF